MSEADRFTWDANDVQFEDPDEGAEDLGEHLTPGDLQDTPPRGAKRVEKAEKTPGEAEAAERLRQYWEHGEGAGKIRWGEPGDFDRCVAHVGKYMRDPKGYCAARHHGALGIWPATHAAMERGHKGEEPDLTKGYLPDASELLNMIIGLMDETEND